MASQVIIRDGFASQSCTKYRTDKSSLVSSIKKICPCIERMIMPLSSFLI